MTEALIGLLVCSRPRTDGGCGSCPDCRMTAAGSHPDVLRLEGTGQRFGIDQVRRIQAALAYRPRGDRHIFVVDPADQLTTEAANALLKTLEEPQGKAVFFLLSPCPERIPLTVRSRCIRVPFRRLSRDEIRRGLETMGYMGPEAEVAAALAEGSLGCALEIVRGKQHLLVRDEMIDLAQRAPAMRPAEITVIARKIGTRDALEERLRTLLVWYRDVLLWRETGETGLLVNADRLDEIRGAGTRYSAGELAGIIRSIDEAIKMLAANGNPRLIVEVLLLALSGRKCSGGRGVVGG